MMNLKKIDPVTIALALTLAAAVWWKNQEPKKEAYKCGGGCGR